MTVNPAKMGAKAHIKWAGCTMATGLNLNTMFLLAMMPAKIEESEMSTIYSIKTLQPSPSMMHDKTVFNGAYQEAVAAAIEQWKATGRSTSLYFGTYGTYWYYRIDADGNATDRNQPGGETHHVHELARQEVA